MSGANWTEEQFAAHRAQLRPPVAGFVRPVLPAPVGRIAKPEMNKTEASYDAYLTLLECSGTVLWHRFEMVTIKLGHDCRLTPDFLLMLPDGRLEFHDTKGAKKIKTGKRAGQRTAYAEEDALVKARVLASIFVIPIYFVWPEPNGAWGKREL